MPVQRIHACPRRPLVTKVALLCERAGRWEVDRVIAIQPPMVADSDSHDTPQNALSVPVVCAMVEMWRD